MTAPVPHSITLACPAKINLTLEILGKRADGYHEIVTILQTIDLCDSLTVRAADRLHLRAPGLDCGLEENLVMKAARLLQSSTGSSVGAEMALTKRIPAAAGLGGGSSDAAAALVALNRLWGLGLSPATLTELAARLGSDVPFFLGGSTALARGRGELLEPLPPVSGLWAVLTIPPLDIPQKTKALYGALRPTDLSDGAASLRLAGMLRDGRSLPLECLRNTFERPAFELYPLIASYSQAMLAAGAPFVRLSGSGPSLYTLYASREAATDLVQSLAAAGITALVAALESRCEP